VTISASPRLRRQAGRCPSTLNVYSDEPAPTLEEEQQIIGRIRAGDESGRRELVTRNMRLVGYYTRRYRLSGPDRQDLEQAGFQGLIHASHKFDPARSNRFVTYASYWIRSYLQREYASQIRRRPNPVDFDFTPGLLSLVAMPPDFDELEMLERLRSAFARLPRYQRVALGRRFGFVPAGETAGTMIQARTVCKNTYQSAVRRGLIRLRAALAD
jgi:RNA polymerase sporulation-specific sigma factor